MSDDRRARARAQADALDRARRGESARAQELIDAFLERAAREQVAPVELRATLPAAES